MDYEVYFDSPQLYFNSFDFYSVGSSPFLLKKLLAYFKSIEDSIEEIGLAFYLFNNSILNDYLIGLSQKAVTINVVTIPIEGYDAEKPKTVIDIESREKLCCATKFDLARKIFKPHFKRAYEHFNFYFFPHRYLRSKYVKGFSRGNIPYSLHTKSILIKKKDGKMDICISSSNFAVRDLVKEENLLIIKGEPKYAAPVAAFFEKLIASSIRIDQFNFNGNYSNYKVGFEKKALCRSGDFMAPFYYNSPFLVEDYITERLKSAQSRIIIVGQHICPVDYTIDKRYHTDFAGKPDFIRKGFVNVLVEKAEAGIPVEILSQTFASGDDQFDEKFRSPANKKAFYRFYSIIKNIEGIKYAVNENVHSKYIVIDDQVFVTTFNYTPTEFIYLDNVRIDHFQNNKARSYSGIFSEVGQFVAVDSKPLVEEYVENFKLIKNRKNTLQVKG